MLSSARNLGKAKLRNFTLKNNHPTPREIEIGKQIKKLMNELFDIWDEGTKQVMAEYDSKTKEV